MLHEKETTHTRHVAKCWNNNKMYINKMVEQHNREKKYSMYIH